MLLGIVAGLCVVYWVKLRSLRRVVDPMGSPKLGKWAKLEAASVRAFVFTGLVACGIRLFGCFLIHYLGVRSAGRQTTVHAYMSPTTSLIVASSVVVVIGLVISAVMGTRAERYRRDAGVSNPVELGGLAKVGLFALGWFGFFLTLSLLSHHAARANGMFS